MENVFLSRGCVMEIMIALMDQMRIEAGVVRKIFSHFLSLHRPCIFKFLVSLYRCVDHHLCKQDHFRCPNNTCIPLSHLCDGVDNCGDNYDEEPEHCDYINHTVYCPNVYCHSILNEFIIWRKVWQRIPVRNLCFDVKMDAVFRLNTCVTVSMIVMTILMN